MNRLICLFLLIGGASTISIAIILREAHQLSQSIEQQQQQQQPLKRLLQASSNGTATNNLKTNNTPRRRSVTIDFYRTVEERSCLGISYQAFSFPRWRLPIQISFLNFWFEGRVHFVVGDIYTIEDAFFKQPKLPCFDPLKAFAKSPEIRTKQRISALFVRGLEGSTNGCALLDVPLGGSVFGNAPTLVLTETNDTPIAGTLGAQNLIGATISHEMGHVFGLGHTAWREEQVVAYTKCGLNLRYPEFVGTFTEVVLEPRRSNNIWDNVTGELYQYSDWKGRSNVMASFNPFHILQFWTVGIFSNDYEPIFDEILDCWFTRSAAGGDTGGDEGGNSTTSNSTSNTTSTNITIMT